MEKPQYNQGDLLHFHRLRPTIREHQPQLLVITDVFTTGLGKYADTYYKFKWIGDGSENVYQINTLDDDLNFKLLARGQ
jgi:hypothetical protein